ncbi:hypothetical protein [Nostoc sp. NMS8]|nr:hypothetical protein [Nostoc sp. NMS8]MBN3960487.1 hypothetical protein [Nostoc sp. NMS8]
MEIGVPVSERTQLPSINPADIENALAAAAKYGLEIIPPSAAESLQVS